MEGNGGILHVSLHAVGIDADGNELDLPTGQFMKLSVSDTGVGMDEATLERACEPFFTTKEFGKGSGLGLSIVHGIVAGHGGRMLIESKKGKGTTFMIYLPRFDPEALEKKLLRDVGLQGLEHTGRERILLVDDEKAITELHKITLEDMGYSIAAFTDSQMALMAFQEHPENFDLVITDQSMPRLPGSELAAELIKIRNDIPIILCTGYSSVISEEQAANLGIRKFLMKPVTRKELAGAIRESLDKNTAGQQPSRGG
jgi:CheY-like chemotaxis protein